MIEQKIDALIAALKENTETLKELKITYPNTVEKNIEVAEVSTPLNTLDGKEIAKIENIGRTLDEIIQEADNSIIGKKEDSQKIVPANVTRQEVTTLSYDIFKATKADSKERKELTDIYTEYAGSLDITKVKDEDLNVLYGKLQDLFKKI